MEEGAKKVSLGFRPVGVMGVAEESSVSDSLISWLLSVMELLLAGPSSASELADLRGFLSKPHFFKTGSRYFFK